MTKTTLTSSKELHDRVKIAEGAANEVADPALKQIAFQVLLHHLLTKESKPIEELITDRSKKAEPKPKAVSHKGTQGREEELTELVNKTKESEEFSQIEKSILDGTSVVDRLLLPLYILHEYFSDRAPLTSGDMAKYLSQFSVNIAQQNIANNLSSSASRYVIADRVRRTGAPVHYKISRKGLSYLKSVIKGTSDE